MTLVNMLIFSVCARLMFPGQCACSGFWICHLWFAQSSNGRILFISFFYFN